MPPAKARADCSEAMLMMRPPPLARMPATQARARKKGIVRFSVSVRCHDSGVIASGGSRRFTPAARSEEHTSELQSLMRTSYAVVRLQKKNKHDSQKDTKQ